MSDIDFDELDRAVASVLKSPESPAQADANADEKRAVDEPVVVRTSSSKPAAAPEPATAKPAAPPAQALHPVAQKPVQRGRFLDMVHPSHDMAPRSVVHVGERAATHDAAPDSSNQTFVSEVVSPAEPPKAVETVAPGPFPVHETTEPASAEEHTDFFAEAPSEDPSKAGDFTPPPFIPDAKVEKRPLGAFSAGEGASDAVQPSLPIGEALHDKLVEVESEDNIATNSETAVPVSAAPPTVVAASLKEDDKPKGEHENLIERMLHHESGVSTARTEPVVKRSKSNLIILTVGLIVVIIGAAVGATLYLFVLPR